MTMRLVNVDLSTDKKDIFLCHASEDKEKIVRPIFNEFNKMNITCWFDEAEISWGDSIIDKVNEGLKNSLYIIVVMSSAFMDKNWVFRELNSMLNIEASNGKVRILPLLSGSDKEVEKIQESFPIINDKSYIRWKGDPTKIVESFISIKGVRKNLSNRLKKHKIRKMHPLVRNYIIIGGSCGIALDITLFNSGEFINSFIFIFIVPLIYSMFIYFAFNINLNNSLYKKQRQKYLILKIVLFQ